MFEPPYEATTGIPYLQLFVELLRAVAWPMAIVLALWIFRNDLRPMLAKIESFGPSGVKLSQVSQSSQSLESETKQKLADIELDPLTDPAAKRIEDNIFARIGGDPC
ncbi:hypothetical protein [Roseovarius tolerans]|uniref:hypothetical protein n=1 Tax=Roseovarius tolerans TaxID=74031 RepID=UPI001113335D|nr:hypothetical protein [Roseovarius tolerans]